MDSNISSRVTQVLFFYSLTLTFIVYVKVLAFFLFAYVWKTVSDRANITIAIREEVMYLPSIGANGNTLHHDIDLHFQGHEF